MQNLNIWQILILGATLLFSYQSYSVSSSIESSNSEDMEYLKTSLSILLIENRELKILKNLRETPCYSCHREPESMLPMRSLNNLECINYVRGERLKPNTLMPIFSKKELSDEKLLLICSSIY